MWVQEEMTYKIPYSKTNTAVLITKAGFRYFPGMRAIAEHLSIEVGANSVERLLKEFGYTVLTQGRYSIVWDKGVAIQPVQFVPEQRTLLPGPPSSEDQVARLKIEKAKQERALEQRARMGKQMKQRSYGFKSPPDRFAPLPDWHRLDPKDRSAVLQEQGINISPNWKLGETPGLIGCSTGLLQLRDYLKRMAIPDEYKASQEYKDTAKKFTGLNLPVWALALTHLASDEAEHAAILNIIVDVITEKCR